MANFSEDDEVVQSIRYIQRQRNTKLVLAVVVLFGLLVLTAVFVGLAYSGGPEAAKSVPAQQ